MRYNTYNTYNTYSSPDYGRYRRHANIFLGWQTSFIAEGKRWNWKLGPQNTSKLDCELKILDRFPDATEITARRIISEE